MEGNHKTFFFNVDLLVPFGRYFVLDACDFYSTVLKASFYILPAQCACKLSTLTLSLREINFFRRTLLFFLVSSCKVQKFIEFHIGLLNSTGIPLVFLILYYFPLFLLCIRK